MNASDLPELSQITISTLHAAMNAERIKIGISWRTLAKDIGTSPATLSRMPQKSPSVDSFLKMIFWLSKRGYGIDCTHDGAIMVGGVGSLENPPLLIRICLKCGQTLGGL